jgi:threonine/homoserine/homoserine lactone efflux protein
MTLQIIDAILKGVAVGLAMAISVGPTLIAVIKYSLSYSYKAGLAFVLGVCMSDVLYVTVANLAVTWLVFIRQFSTYIAVGGALVLITAGTASLVMKKKQEVLSEDNKILVSNSRLLRIFFSGYLINTLNPGVIFSWLAAVSATANRTGSYRFVLFGTCLGLILSIDFLKVFLADKIRRNLTPNRVAVIQKVSALIILFLGVLLLVYTLFIDKGNKSALA